MPTHLSQDRIVDLNVSDSGLIFDPVTGAISTSNSMGVLILRALQQGKTVGQIQESVSREYGISIEKAERDLTDFLAQLNSCGIH